ncbi:hypothetical protein FRC01_003519 [Tulasnella sp. 417]|nr:hypothetical protein FRC01_003519 [Tulasnella sp. 417]
MHARLDIEADPTEFSEAIHDEIKLPPEILSEIALLAQASDAHAHIKLSHVDSSFRAFVNSTPLLWTRVDFLVTALLPLHIDSPYYTASPAHHVLQGIKEDENTRLKEFLRALRPHRHRIISLRLRSYDIEFEVPGEDEQQTPAYDFLWDGSMVKLELLDLELNRWRWEGIEALPLSYAVKELHLHRSWTVEYIPLFSSSLRSLVVTNDDAEFPILFNALQAAPRLTSLTLRDISFVWTVKKEEVTLNLDQLESLSLVRVVCSAAETLLNSIVTPNLTSIALHLVGTVRLIDHGTEINELQLFLLPRPSVRRLDLTACDGSPSFFASAYQAFPYLTHLRIASSNLSEDHLLPLAVKSSDPGPQHGFPTVCPSLKHLTIDNEFNDIAVVISQMAQLRRSLGSPLESVTLRGIPVGSGLVYGVLGLDRHVAKIELDEFDQEEDVYGESDDGSASETSSEGDWASGDEEIVTAFRKVGGAVYEFWWLAISFSTQK